MQLIQLPNAEKTIAITVYNDIQKYTILLVIQNATFKSY